MTNLPPNMPPMPDPRRILAKLQADVRTFEARAERTRAALDQAAVEARSEHVTLKVLGSHVVGIEFEDSALALSAPQLSEEVRRAMSEASARTNHASAEVVRHAFGDETAARGVEESVPEEIARQRDEMREDGTLTTDPDVGLDAGTMRAMSSDELDDLMDDILHRMDTSDEPPNLAELAEQVGYQKHRLTVPPEQEQARFEAQMADIHRRAAAIPQLMTTVEGTGATELVEVRVNATGTLVSTRFQGAFARSGTEALAESFLEAYAAARSDASAALSRELGEIGLSRPADAPRDFGF